MHQIQIQLTDQLLNLATRRAGEAGFTSADEYIADMVSDDLTSETEDRDHRLTPKVVGHLDQIRHEINSGAKTYSQEEVDDYLKEKAKAWRQSCGN